jgi:pilus assembly protein TadC
VVPALPMCGVFMAACEWDIKKSLIYIYLGGLIKYSIILIIFGFLDWLYNPDIAFWITLISVIVFLIPSFFLGRRKQKRLLEKVKAEQPTVTQREF